MVVQGHVTHERLLQIFTTGEAMGFEHLSDTSVGAAEVTQSLSINCSMTSLAMNSGYRFGSMQSSGMRQLTNTLAKTRAKPELFVTHNRATLPKSINLSRSITGVR